MLKKNLLLFAFLILSIDTIHAQSYFGIEFPSNRKKKCGVYVTYFQQMPKEVRFSIEREKSNLYFTINSKEWFDKLFKNDDDGIAIDIVMRDSYVCSVEDYKEGQIRGLLLKPVYAKKLKTNVEQLKDGNYRVLVGRIPTTILKDELEYNILFLHHKILCRYYWIYELESYPWELLDMGLYLDSITYNPKIIKPVGSKSFSVKYKTLSFKIPFEKNKSEYLKKDIKPLYDSLRLTNFTIKKINIRAYSSIEGSTQRNLILQKQRAASIAKALQTYQKPTIITEVYSSENWVEFLNDIGHTKYENLKSLPKAEIKEKVVGDFAKELEPILKNHRKAVVTLFLEKKDTYKNNPVKKLISLFNSSMAEGTFEKAANIQNSIFNKLKESQLDPSILNKMEIPKRVSNAPLLYKNSVFKYMMNQSNLFMAYQELKDLEKLVPNNGRVKYNLIVLKLLFWNWYQTDGVVENYSYQEIRNLKKYGIPKVLIDRMLVNYHILEAKRLMQIKEYAKKDASVSFILENYKKIPLSDNDYLSLAQFLSHYANTKEAANLLDKRARSIDVSEDLLFYYLNLTIIHKDLTHSLDYRTILLNAVNMDKKRFCKLFNSIEKGGVTFQILSDDYLKKTYCENCNNK